MHLTYTDYINLENKGFQLCAAHGALYTTDGSAKGCGRCEVDRTRNLSADNTVINPSTGKRYTGKALKARRDDLVYQMLGRALDTYIRSTPERLDSYQHGWIPRNVHERLNQ